MSGGKDVYSILCRWQTLDITNDLLLPATHRRMKQTEEKAKVVAAVWGTELIQFFLFCASLRLFWIRMIWRKELIHASNVQTFYSLYGSGAK